MNVQWWIVLLSAVGTFLMRWLPLRHALRQRTDTPRGALGPRQRFMQTLLAGVGAAAVTALLTVSLWAIMRQSSGLLPSLLAITAGLAAVASARIWFKGIAWPTLVGALAYGLVSQWLGGWTLA